MKRVNGFSLWIMLYNSNDLALNYISLTNVEKNTISTMGINLILEPSRREAHPDKYSLSS